MAYLNYLEAVADQSPTSFGCSMETGKASIQYILSEVQSVTDISQAITELVGEVTVSPGAGSLSRILPWQHPYLPWYAAGISSMRGIGSAFTVVNTSNFPWYPQQPAFPLYNTYQITVDFQPRPYPVLADNATSTGVATTWVLPQSGGEEQSFTYFPEYERFCEVEITPSADVVSSQVGQLCFNAVGLLANSRPFTAMPRQFMNNENLKIKWSAVPLSYFTDPNSYLRRFRGTVNQNPIVSANLGSYGPGELLYLGCTMKMFTPPQGLELTFGGEFTTWQKLCNLELNFTYTKRPRGADPLHFPADTSVITQGHNLQPFLGNGNDPLSGTFLFASTVKADGPNATGFWQSGPHELLFTSPSATDHI